MTSRHSAPEPTDAARPYCAPRTTRFERTMWATFVTYLLAFFTSTTYARHGSHNSKLKPGQFVDMPDRGQNPGMAYCKKISNATHQFILSPLYPEKSQGGSCKMMQTFMMPRSADITVTNVDLAEGDYLIFQDVFGTVVEEGPLDKEAHFGFTWPFFFTFATKNTMTDSVFKVAIGNFPMPHPCNEVIYVEKQGFIIASPGDEFGRMPPNLFCEIRFTVDTGNHIEMRFVDLNLKEGDEIQLHLDGPNLMGGDFNLYKLSHRSKNSGQPFLSEENIISLFLQTGDGPDRGYFKVRAEKAFE